MVLFLTSLFFFCFLFVAVVSVYVFTLNFIKYESIFLSVAKRPWRNFQMTSQSVKVNELQTTFHRC